jgi:hypothetical protein
VCHSVSNLHECRKIWSHQFTELKKSKNLTALFGVLKAKFSPPPWTSRFFVEFINAAQTVFKPELTILGLYTIENSSARIKLFIWQSTAILKSYYNCDFGGKWQCVSSSQFSQIGMRIIDYAFERSVNRSIVGFIDWNETHRVNITVEYQLPVMKTYATYMWHPIEKYVSVWNIYSSLSEICIQA